MAKLLLLVHGMGSNPAGWSASIQAKLDEVAGRYSAFRTGDPFSARVHLAEITYDDVLAEVVERWQAEAEALGQFATAQGRPLPKLVSWLQSPLPHGDAAKSFFWSTAVDPLLYRGFALVRDQVRAVVTARVAAALAEAMADGAVEVSVLAHSLGTAVMHDSLQALGAAPYEGNEALVASNFQFANVFMLADVCELGPRALLDVDYLSSVVRPTTAGGAAGSYCQFFVNVWHRYDPFVLAAPFRPTNWGDNYVPIGPLEHFHQANVHAFTHYLDHPAVHVPLINATLGSPVVGVKEEQDALARYPQIGSPECSAQIASLINQATEFEHAGSDLEDLVIRIAEFYASAQRCAEACKGLLGDNPLA